MKFPVEISVTAPFAVGDVVARLSTDDRQSVAVVLRDGHFRSVLPACPTRMTLTLEPPPPGESALQIPSGSTSGSPIGKVVDVHTLFEEGVPMPADGRLEVQLLWGAHCHSDRLPHLPEGKRFGSWEHVVCADWVGRESIEPSASRLRISGVEAPFDKTTVLPLGRLELNFGQIVCLAGDYYAHLDTTAANDLVTAWPPLDGLLRWLGGDYRATTLDADDRDNVAALLRVIARDKDEHRGWFGEFAVAVTDTVRERYPARRYLALSAQNFCHFVSPGPVAQPADFAYWVYAAYHARALDQARRSAAAANPRPALLAALAIDAFGCHFLSDHFAGGHLRVPRRLLAERYGVLRGSLGMSLSMHNEDNRTGLWCRARAIGSSPRVVWRAYGDGMLLRAGAEHNLRQVQEAIRRSAAEVFAASRNKTLSVNERADAILPVPLPPGKGPAATDTYPDLRTTPPSGAEPNPWPLYWFDVEGNVLVRDGGPEWASYRHADGRRDKEPRPAPMVGAL